jgi:hypothetical protein
MNIQWNKIRYRKKIFMCGFLQVDNHLTDFNFKIFSWFLNKSICWSKNLNFFSLWNFQKITTLSCRPHRKAVSDFHKNWETTVFRCALQNSIVIVWKFHKEKIQVFVLIYRLVQKSWKSTFFFLSKLVDYTLNFRYILSFCLCHLFLFS